MVDAMWMEKMKARKDGSVKLKSNQCDGYVDSKWWENTLYAIYFFFSD